MSYLKNWCYLSTNINGSSGLMLFCLGCRIVTPIYLSIIFGITVIMQLPFPVS